MAISKVELILNKVRLFALKPVLGRSNYPSYWYVCKILLIYDLFFIICFGKLDLDFGWHLKSGEYYLEHGIPDKDIFSYTASDFQWVNHEWLSDIFLSLLFGISGFLLLAMVYAALWSLAVFISVPKARLFTLLLGVGALVPYVGIRPIAWTALLFALLVKICDQKSSRIKLFLPFIFLLWANIHGGFIIGFFVVGYFAVKNRDKTLLYILPVSALATLVNPYGHKLYEEIARTLFDSSLRFQIVEWMPAAFWGSTVLLIALWATGFILFDAKKMKNWANLAPILLLSGFLSTRNTPFFILTAIKDLDRYYDSFVAELPKKGTKKVMRARAIVIALVLILVAGWFGYANRTFANFLTSERENNYPRMAVSYLAENGCKGNIFNLYDFGGFIIWKLPGYKVYIDGRMPSWESESGQKYIDTYLDIFNDDAVRRNEFKKHNVQCVIVTPSDVSLLDKMKGEGWSVKSEEGNAVLLVGP